MDDVQCIECKHFVARITRYGFCEACDAKLEEETMLIEIIREKARRQEEK